MGGGGGKDGSLFIPTPKQAINPLESSGINATKRAVDVVKTGRDKAGRTGIGAIAAAPLLTSDANDTLLG